MGLTAPLLLLGEAGVLLPRKGVELMPANGLLKCLPMPLWMLLLLGLLTQTRLMAPAVWGLLPETLLLLVVRAGACMATWPPVLLFLLLLVRHTHAGVLSAAPASARGAQKDRAGTLMALSGRGLVSGSVGAPPKLAA
jgi:hypothetical protein